MGRKVTTPVGRVIWTDLKTKDKFGKHGIRLAFDEDTDLSELEQAVNEVGKDKWPTGMPKAALYPIQNGNDQVNSDGEVWDTCKDMTVIRFRNEKLPESVNQNKDPIGTADSIYSGCYVRIRTDIYAYDKGKGGINCDLDMIQFVRDGVPLSTGKIEDPKEVFDSVELAEGEEAIESSPWT